VNPEELAGLPAVAQLMVRLCEIPSPSRDESAVAAYVRGELEAMGAAITEDDAATAIGAGCGNIVAHFAPTAEGGTPIALCAHLDTVPNSGPIEVELADGFLSNRHDDILGGDNKSAVAAILTAVRTVCDEGRPHAGIDVLLTPCEEIGLRGATHFDPSRLNGRMAFVFDHTGPLGGIVSAAPSLKKLTATFVGRTAHAGIVPELGRSAIDAAARAISRMPLGRIDPVTTANIGTISGGTATNVVAERCTITAETRSLNDQVLAQQLMAMLDALTWAATEGEVDLETRVVNEFTGYRLSARDPQVALAMDAIRSCGLEPQLVETGGGSDTNAFLLNGLPSVNLCNDMIDVHTGDERIAVRSLERTVEVALAVIDTARTFTP
jgi:tripeptide aminopeptidase